MLDGNERIIKHKLVLLNLAEELGNASRACRIMGLYRDTFTVTKRQWITLESGIHVSYELRKWFHFYNWLRPLFFFHGKGR